MREQENEAPPSFEKTVVHKSKTGAGIVAVTKLAQPCAKRRNFIHNARPACYAPFGV